MALLFAVLAVLPLSSEFGYDIKVIDMPLRELFASLFAIGCVYLCLLVLIPQTLNHFRQAAPEQNSLAKPLLLFVLATGLLLRLLMLFSAPLMEDDYQRYMWDGALVAHGFNPYALSPENILDGTSGEPELEKLAEQSGLVLERVNHPSLRTIYPPVAQLGFAAAYELKPFSLNAWRIIAIFCELISLALLITLLKHLNRSKLWVALYWWNPLIIKELVGSGHMEVLLVPLLLGALWATIRKTPTLGTFLLALAVGVKIWPGLLLPLFLRSFLASPLKLVAPLLLFFGLIGLMALPILAAGFDPNSGFTAYASQWKTNSALFLTLEGIAYGLISLIASPEDSARFAGLGVRLAIMLTLALIALVVAWRRPLSSRELIAKTLTICAAMFFLSPAQLPWYAAWFLPFMVFFPLNGLALLVPLLQFYYLSFYYLSRGEISFYATTLVWLIWIPVWGVLAVELKRNRPPENGPQGTTS